MQYDAINPIKLLRTLAGLRQVQLARAAKIATCRLSQAECEYIGLKPDELARIAQVLGVDVSVLGGKAAA